MKKTLYLECYQGAAGDMLLGALYELLPDKAAFTEAMNRLHPEISVTFEAASSCGIAGTHAKVVAAGQEEHSHDHHDHGEHHDDPHGHHHYHGEPEHHHDHGPMGHHHASLAEITAMIDGFDLPERVL